ncbi:MAG: dihydroorotase [Lachnospiraceae bacterium]|nr:dihydroorotase [Lachnospiraceae bacterium]
MLLIANAYLMNPAAGEEGCCDILIRGERILRIEQGLYEKLRAKPMQQEQLEKISEAEESDITVEDVDVIDGSGLIAAPGLVDVHSHFRDPGFTYKEDIVSGARAAARGGYTTVVLMANTKPAVDSAETLSYVLKKGRETDIHIETCATVTMGMQGRELTAMETLYEQGAAGFTDDGVPILDAELVRKAMKKAKKLDVPISFHEENPAYIQNNGVNAGAASVHFGIGGSPREAEIDLVGRDLELALETGACINIQHISSKEAVELVRLAKRKGGDIHAEATPHHFTLTEVAVIKYGTLAKMNPPLREESDRRAIIEGLRDGTIDMIATDHAPHSREEKEKSITEAPSGIIGLETALALGITELVDKGELTMMSLLGKLTCNPAGIYHLDAGYLAEGGPADIVLFDPKEEFAVKDFSSKSVNSPFTGWKLKGVVKYTICGGKVVYQSRMENAV